MITEVDLKNLEEIIKEDRKPIYFETPYGKFAFVLSDKAKEYVINQGFIPVKVKDLENLITGCKSYEEQKAKVEEYQKALSDFFKEVFRVKKLFQGQVKTFKDLKEGKNASKRNKRKP